MGGSSAIRKKTRYGGINREEDLADLHVTRLVTELAGLIHKYKGRFILSRYCRRLLADNGLAAIYPRLFRAYVEQFNWAYRDRYPELRFMQNSFLFTLYLLTRYGDTWRPQVFFEDAFLHAFPMLLDEVPPSQVFSPDDTLRQGYTWRASAFRGLSGTGEGGTDFRRTLVSRVPGEVLAVAGPDRSISAPQVKLHGEKTPPG